MRFLTSNFLQKLESGDRVISCLLYTSDAADDMQCVDLGGRRIIKKKKITQSYDEDVNNIKNV